MVHEAGAVASATCARALLNQLVVIEGVDVKTQEPCALSPGLPEHALISDEALRFVMSHDSH